MTESLAARALEGHLSYFEWAKVPGRLDDAYRRFLMLSGYSQAYATGMDPDDAIRAMGYTPEALSYYARSELEMLNEAPTIGVSGDMLDVAIFNGGIWWENHGEDHLVENLNPSLEGWTKEVSADDPNWGTLGFEADQHHLPVLTKEMLPWQEKPGFLWFDKPVPYPDFDINMLMEAGAESLPSLDIKAIGWKVVPEVAVGPGDSVPGVAIFLWHEHAFTGQLTLLDFTGWAFGHEFEIDPDWQGTLRNAAVSGDINTTANTVAVRDDGTYYVNPHVAMVRLLLCSIWGLMTETIERVRPARPIRRRAERSGLGSFHEYGEVQVITLRHFLDIAGSRKPQNEPMDEVEWSHRWIVRGHWAWRHCSAENADEGETCRKRVYINPYVKGPEDKPLILKEKVYAVVR